MLYKFNTNITDKDYLELNEFSLLKTKEAKKRILLTRVVVTVIFAFFIVAVLISGEFTLPSIIISTILALSVIISQILHIPTLRRSIKANIKNLKKQGKLPYSPTAELEFYEDKLIETTPSSKSEVMYTQFEKVCVIGQKMIYLFNSSISAYLLPASAFNSKEQLNEFLEFIKTKVPKTEYYDK